jgi:hypothetical protein
VNEFRSGLEAIHFVAKGASWGQAPSVFFREHGEDVEVWGVNNMFYHHRNIDRSFLLHDPRQEIVFEDKDFLQRVRKIDHPIYTSRKHEALGPMNRVFPAKEILESYPIEYYTNVVCWMIALAILLEPQAIYLHGVDMALAVEYSNERGAVEYWVGVAVGKGMPVHIPSNSRLCTTDSSWGICYGYIPRKDKTGMILDLVPDYKGFNKPQILEDYVLITREEYEEITGSNTSTGRIKGDTEEKSSEGGRQVASGVER